MNKKLVTRSRAINLNRGFSILLVLALLVPLVVMVPVPEPLRAWWRA